MNDRGDRVEENETVRREKLFESGRRARGEASELVSALGDVVQWTEAILRKNLESRPYGVLSAAAAAGYVVGGGLTGRLASRLLVAGGRIALNAAVEGALARAVDGSAGHRTSEEDR